jgi:hypothetical protein
MEKLDIINLIELNPITKLSNTFNNKLLNKIKEQFTDVQQQLFISSFYCYLNYNQTTDFVIDLDNIWQWLGFSQKIRAKELLEKNFMLDNDYKSLLHNLTGQKKDGRGGHNKETIMLNIKTFKLFCIKASTKKAHEIHEYFIKLEELLHDVILEESNELKMQLTKKNIEIEVNKKELSLKNHKTFIQAYNNKNVVYIYKLNEIDDKIVIKIGSTQSIKDRSTNISTVFDLPHIFLIQVVQSDNHVKFERFLHNHVFIKKYNYPIEMKNKKLSTETYLVNQEELDEILKIIDMNKNQFENKDNILVEEIRLKTEETRKINETISLGKEIVSLEKEKIILKQKELGNYLHEFEKCNVTNDDILVAFGTNKLPQPIIEPVSTIDSNITTCNYMIKERKYGKRIPKIYQYNPSDLKNPIKVFDSPTEVERELENISLSQLKRSATDNTIYKNFRWLSLNRTEKLPESIPETKVTKHKSPDIKYIAMIDIKKTKIMEVFASQKQAVEARNMKSKSFTRAIQNDSISSGHYWKFFEDCSEEMKEAFLLTSKLPEKYAPTSGKRVEQIDPKTNNVIATYYSNREICKKFQMSVLSLKKASETGNLHHGYKWKIIH